MRNLLNALSDGTFFFLIGLFFVIIAVLVYVLFTSFRKGKKAFNLYMILLFPLHGIGFWIIYDLFTLPPEGSCGCGNPGILFMVPLGILFILFNVILGRWAYEHIKNFRVLTLWSMTASSILLIIVLINFEIKYILDIYNRLQLEYQPDFYTTMHGNGIYFNTYTYLLYLSVTLLIISSLSLIKKYRAT